MNNGQYNEEVERVRAELLKREEPHSCDFSHVRLQELQAMLKQ